jgi:hypothetical protein
LGVDKRRGFQEDVTIGTDPKRLFRVVRLELEAAVVLVTEKRSFAEPWPLYEGVRHTISTLYPGQ